MSAPISISPILASWSLSYRSLPPARSGLPGGGLVCMRASGRRARLQGTRGYYGRSLTSGPMSKMLGPSSWDLSFVLGVAINARMSCQPWPPGVMATRLTTIV
ncbi:hypothetical protein OH76DRAFT_1057764 [Lentinus brumalis]|uniref:Uncharacterized protein n=1 Tax=Lentinus brumalis TaxID=2498619 RepID=A0A371DND3_9APHY|nr:hypothetical protein OH76DRAFT_1057764 [Polyporus brumalis]